MMPEKILKILLGASILLAFFMVSWALGKDYGVTVGTSPTVVLPQLASGVYHYVMVDNESTTATIACTTSPTAPAVGINTAGSFTIASGSYRVWGSASAWYTPGPVTCISSAASTPVSVEAQ